MSESKEDNQVTEPAADAEAPQAEPEVQEDTAAETAEASEQTEPQEPVEIPEDLDLRVEAALLTSPQPMNAARVGAALGGIPANIITEAIDRLNAHYSQTERSFRIESVAGGYRIMTLQQFGDVLAGITKQKATEAKLRPQQLETLAIVAYKQPVTRVDVEMIRGVACGDVLRGLMDRHLVKVVGRADEIGRPMLYGTTKKFLEIFGLASLKDLPNTESLTPIE
ncbi:SMC-Scp complex subunit ScpB [Poriferisphaera sp. WC338]|uniref:SMC-Scp complex subunit ScpB n=1 Tax=Poriferisphaera sp. WC338 TaxID=3425129 RepID=UPI003D813625